MAVAATGFFDGVHMGHRKVLGQLCNLARSRGEESIVVSFWPHPRCVLQQDAAKLRLLTTLEEKKRLCREFGVDRFEVLTFSHEFSMLTAREFLMQHLVPMGVTTLILGYDHRLGHDVVDDPARMFEIVRECGIEPVRVEEFTSAQSVSFSVSSTTIRRMLSEGDVRAAASLLGYAYGIDCSIADRQVLEVQDAMKLIPAVGDYLVRLSLASGDTPAVCRIRYDGTIKVVTSGMELQPSSGTARVQFLERC